MKLRYFLILIFFLLSLAPVILFQVWPHSAALRTEIAEAQKRHLLLARNLSSSLEHYAGDVSTTFTLLMGDLEAWQGTTEFRQVAGNFHIRNICLADRATGRVATHLSLAEFPCPDAIDPALLGQMNAIARPGTVAFGDVTSAAGGENVMHLASPFDDRFLAIGSIRTDYFRELGGSISSGHQGGAIIVDQAGNVLSHPLPDWVAARRNLMGEHPIVQRMLGGTSGVDMYYSSALDANMLAGFTTVPGLGWGVLIPQPVEELFAKAESARHAAVLVMLLGVTGSLLLAMLVSLLISRPLEVVTEATREVASGNLTPPKKLRTFRFMPDEVNQLFAGFHDMIVRLRESTVKVNSLAFVDGITGLANREYFRRSVNAFIDGANIGDGGAMLFLDLDGFKAVNDTKGHDTGDAVLVEVARRMADLVGIPLLADTTFDEASIVRRCQKPVIARLGGDEFAIFLPNTDSDAAMHMAVSILVAMEPPLRVSDCRLTLSASIGVARFPDDAVDCSTLLKAADTAMYEAKRAGKNQASRYYGNLPARDATRHRLADDLFSKDMGSQLDMFFQPIYRATDLSLAGIESLIRWHHPDEGLLRPGAFMEVAAELGLQRQIDKVAFDGMTEAVRDVQSLGIPPVNFSINMSLERLVDKSFTARIIRTLPADFPLSIELKESSLLDALDTRAAWAVDCLKEAGVSVELDDFGSTHASITSLLDLGPSRIKLDAHLISRVAPNSPICTIVKSITTMAHDLNIEVVAKGVEKMHQVELLHDLGCDHVQGYALNMPMTKAELIVYLTHLRPKVLA